jgi:peptide/nickel transport system permease protein
VTRFVLRRLVFSTLVLVGVLFVVNLLLLLTGNPARALLPINAGQEQIDSLQARLGLNDPFPVQFAKFLGRVVQGDFGESVRHNRSALGLVAERMPRTLQLGVVGMAFSLLAGLPLGALAAAYKDSWIDHAARLLAGLGQAIPGFWLGLMMLLVFGVRLGWLPISGPGDWRHLVMPGIVVGLPAVPAIARLFRSSLIGVLERDYVRTARAKGLGGMRIFRSHVLRNASIPVVTIVAFEVGSIMSGALIAEVIFAYPGMGQLAYQSIRNRDIAVVQVYVALVSVVVLLTNLVLDITYAVLDPRVRVQ